MSAITMSIVEMCKLCRSRSISTTYVRFIEKKTFNGLYCGTQTKSSKINFFSRKIKILTVNNINTFTFSEQNS